MDGGLTRRRLALASLEDVAHQAVGDISGIDAGQRYGALDGRRPQPWGRDGGEGALK